jgi:peptidoglycan hydrolase-like protein with peptidoglycan-binding domain
MGEFTKILKSFSLQDTLNPKIWENSDDVDSSKLKPKVKDALSKIAEKFIDYLGDDIVVDDVTLTGSLANFNWSEYSDFDLHIIIDFSQFGKESKVYKELFDARKFIFNESHNIKIYGYDVELYAQDSEEEHTSSGLYSIMNDEWLHKPKKESPDIDKKILVQKIDSWIEKIEKTIENSEKTDGKKLENLKSKLKEYRKSGLEKEGELSYENLVFKFLRRSGHIEKLFDALNKETDKELSIETMMNEQTDDYTEKLLKYVNDSKFLSDLKSLVGENRKFEYRPGIKIPLDQDVKLIQTALQFLGFSLPRWGVDGKFGPETQTATKDFQKNYGLNDNGIVDDDNLKYIIAALVLNNFKDSDLSTIKKEREYNVAGTTDENFYKKLLQNLGAPVTDENMKFILAWRQAEGRGGKYNPFNTTHKLKDSTKMNSVGVQHYKSAEDGMIATLKTLNNGRYNCIVNGLRNDIGASEIAKCQSLKTWGTGDLVGKVIRNYEKGASPKPPSLA